jgi:UDP-N-acetylmuramyl pentapeptide phosphotransferase/UDP-N-acetylglucosamine-1-phosphate transferase
MGDTGALVIGMMLAINAIHFIDMHYNLPVTNPYKFKAGISGAVCFIIIPLADTLRIFIIRIARKQSPFTPDKSHIHHNIMRLGFSHSKSTILLGLVHVIFIAIAIVCMDYNDNYVLLGILILCIALSVTLDRIIRNRVTKDTV